MSNSLFIIDISSCTGCGTCNIACKERAGLPDELDFLRVEAYEEGKYPNPSLNYRVTHCFHCAQPACATACPTDAILRREDGLVVIDAKKCIGCGDCIEACPFEAIVMLPKNIAAKCDGCADEVAIGWDPTCVRACPMRALEYKPLAETQFSQRLKDTNLNDYGICPAVLYLLRSK